MYINCLPITQYTYRIRIQNRTISFFFFPMSNRILQRPSDRALFRQYFQIFTILDTVVTRTSLFESTDFTIHRMRLFYLRVHCIASNQKVLFFFFFMRGGSFFKWPILKSSTLSWQRVSCSNTTVLKLPQFWPLTRW